jgi:hypothetical protein
VERSNGRIEDVLQSHHFQSGEELEATRHRYVWLHKQQLPQSALGRKTPLQATKDWHNLKPDLFKKQPYYRPGCDSYTQNGSTSEPPTSHGLSLIHRVSDTSMEIGISRLSTNQTGQIFFCPNDGLRYFIAYRFSNCLKGGRKPRSKDSFWHCETDPLLKSERPIHRVVFQNGFVNPAISPVEGSFDELVGFHQLNPEPAFSFRLAVGSY